MKTPLFITPDDLFCQIEAIVTKDPERLSAFHYHELLNGSEAYTEEQILDKRTKHCLAGWVVALTPNAPKYEYMQDNVDQDTADFANRIMKMNGRKPIPNAIIHSDEDSMMKIIRMRAAEERVLLATRRRNLYN